MGQMDDWTQLNVLSKPPCQDSCCERCLNPASKSVPFVAASELTVLAAADGTPERNVACDV